MNSLTVFVNNTIFIQGYSELLYQCTKSVGKLLFVLILSLISWLGTATLYNLNSFCTRVLLSSECRPPLTISSNSWRCSNAFSMTGRGTDWVEEFALAYFWYLKFKRIYYIVQRIRYRVSDREVVGLKPNHCTNDVN